MTRDITRTVELLGLGERHILVRDQATDCVVELPLAHVDIEPAADISSTFDHVITMPRWIAAEAGIA